MVLSGVSGLLAYFGGWVALWFLLRGRRTGPVARPFYLVATVALLWAATATDRPLVGILVVVFLPFAVPSLSAAALWSAADHGLWIMLGLGVALGVVAAMVPRRWDARWRVVVLTCIGVLLWELPVAAQGAVSQITWRAAAEAQGLEIVEANDLKTSIANELDLDRVFVDPHAVARSGEGRWLWSYSAGDWVPVEG